MRCPLMLRLRHPRKHQSCCKYTYQLKFQQSTTTDILIHAVLYRGVVLKKEVWERRFHKRGFPHFFKEV